MSAKIELAEVDKRFANGVEAVRALSVVIAPGQFVSLLGPSGCGKSTALRLIAGLERPSAGRVQVGAAPADERIEVMSYVFQEPTLMPWASVIDNVALPLRIKGTALRPARDRARQALAAVGLAGRASAYPAELSGGMKMRASIARALVTHPAVLLLDEPFAALDEITRHRLNDDLLGLWWQNRFTAVFVTHSVFESVYLSQRIVVMAARPGRVMADLRNEGPYPRDGLFRTSAEYAHLCRVASETLKQAIAA